MLATSYGPPAHLDGIGMAMKKCGTSPQVAPRVGSGSLIHGHIAGPLLQSSVSSRPPTPSVVTAHAPHIGMMPSPRPLPQQTSSIIQSPAFFNPSTHIGQAQGLNPSPAQLAGVHHQQLQEVQRSWQEQKLQELQEVQQQLHQPAQSRPPDPALSDFDKQQQELRQQMDMAEQLARISLRTDLDLDTGTKPWEKLLPTIPKDMMPVLEANLDKCLYALKELRDEIQAHKGGSSDVDLAATSSKPTASPSLPSRHASPLTSQQSTAPESPALNTRPQQAAFTAQLPGSQTWPLASMVGAAPDRNCDASAHKSATDTTLPHASHALRSTSPCAVPTTGLGLASGFKFQPSEPLSMKSSLTQAGVTQQTSTPAPASLGHTTYTRGVTPPPSQFATPRQCQASMSLPVGTGSTSANLPLATRTNATPARGQTPRQVQASLSLPVHAKLPLSCNTLGNLSPAPTPTPIRWATPRQVQASSSLPVGPATAHATMPLSTGDLTRRLLSMPPASNAIDSEPAPPENDPICRSSHPANAGSMSLSAGGAASPVPFPRPLAPECLSASAATSPAPFPRPLAPEGNTRLTIQIPVGQASMSLPVGYLGSQGPLLRPAATAPSPAAAPRAPSVGASPMRRFALSAGSLAVPVGTGGSAPSAVASSSGGQGYSTHAQPVANQTLTRMNPATVFSPMSHSGCAGSSPLRPNLRAAPAAPDPSRPFSVGSKSYTRDNLKNISPPMPASGNAPPRETQTQALAVADTSEAPATPKGKGAARADAGASPIGDRYLGVKALRGWLDDKAETNVNPPKGHSPFQNKYSI